LATVVCGRIKKFSTPLQWGVPRLVEDVRIIGEELRGGGEVQDIRFLQRE
jgi:hypothetical protein